MVTRTTPSASPALLALESEVRQDLVVCLEASPELTIAQLAAQVGRPADALYHHVRALADAGLVTHETRRSGPGRPATVWRLTRNFGGFSRAGRSVRVPAGSGANVRHAERIALVVARASARDYRRAIRAAEAGQGARPVAGRSRVWLDPTERKAMEAALGELLATARAHRPRAGRVPHVITHVIASLPQRRPAPTARSRSGARA